MIREIDILQYSKSSDFCGNSGKESCWLLCIISYHHELVIELRKESLNSFTEPLIGPCRWSPVFLIETVWNLKCYVYGIKKILLYLCIEISLVAKNHAVMVLPLDILEIMNVMNIGRCHVIGMDDSAYATECVELIAIIVHLQGRTVTPCRGMFEIIPAHGTAGCPDILTYLYRFGVNAEYKFIAVHGIGNIFPYLFSKACSELTPLVILSAANKMGKQLSLLAFKTVEKIVFAVNAKSFSSGRKRNDLEIREFWNDASTRDVSLFVNTISGDFLII